MIERGQAEERRYTRVHLPVAAEVSCDLHRCVRQSAHLRDISAGGAFLYVHLEPKVGAVLRVDFVVPGIGSDVQISCEGRVVRVEQAKMGELSGVAVVFDRLSLGPR